MVQAMLDVTGNEMRSLPSQGTPVYDSSGGRIGIVRYAYDAEACGHFAAAKPSEFYYLPFALQDSLRQHGFIQIDCGFLLHDRIALLDQIENADGERLVLKASGEALIRI